MTLEEYMGEPFKMWFDGIDLSSYFIIADVKGRSISANALNTIELPKRDGFYLLGKNKPSTPLTVNAILLEKTDSELRMKINEINRILNTDQAVPISFSDEPEMIYFGLLSSVVEVNEVRGNHIVTLTFSRPHVYKVGQEITKSIDGTPFSYVGTYKAYPVITSTFDTSATSFEVTNQDGLKVKVNYNFQAGDVLELDFNKQKVIINDVVQMTALAWTVSEWFAIRPGQNTLTTTNTAEMTYEERWL